MEILCTRKDKEMNQTNRRFLIPCILLCLLLIVVQCGDEEEEQTADPVNFITDEQGGVLILHGANIDRGAKSSPYYADVDREQILRWSADWGLNFVRLLILWAGVEPQPGVYDEAYFDKVEERIDWFHEAGIYVMLDMHQDVYSEFTCGDGAPEWAVRHDDQPINCPGQWFLGYFEPGVQRCFDNFWNYEGPHSDLQDRYAAMWAAVAERFKDHPAVIAYDIMNEPHPGTMFDAAETLGMESPDSPSPEFDKTRLQPFYQRVINKIREVDEKAWIAFEPRYGGPGNGSPSYITTLTDPRNGPPRLLYAPHLYSIFLENAEAYDPQTDTTIADWEEHRRQEMETLNTPLVNGEWGLGSDWTNTQLFMKEVMDMYDRIMCGWAYWSWDPGGWSWLNPDYTEKETADLIVRVYPQRIAGIPKQFSYDTDTRIFKLIFTDHPQIQGVTQIYVPEKRFYPAGWNLTVSDAEGTWTSEWDSDREVISLTTPKTDGEHTIEITPK